MSETYEADCAPSTPEAILRALQDAGIQGDRLASTFGRIMAAVDGNKAERRRKDRERKQAYRQALSKQTEQTPAPAASSVVPLKPKRAAAGTACPQDRTISPDEYAYGERLGLTRAEIERKHQWMIGWSTANANRQVARKANWHQAFLNYLRDMADEKGKTNGKDRSVGTAAGQLAQAARDGDFIISPRPVLHGSSEIPIRAISKG